MTLGDTSKEIVDGISTYHDKTGTSIDFRMYLSDNVPIYMIHIASTERTYEFRDAAVLIAWLQDINVDIDPNGSAMLRVRAEQILQQKIIKDAELEALAKEIGDLPQTQVIADATKAAEQIRRESEYRLEKLQQAADIIAVEAATKEAELAEAVKNADAEVVAKAEELIAQDLAKNGK